MRPVRAVAAFAVGVLCLVLMPLLGSPAQAATCPTYPPSAGAQIAVSTTTPPVGEPITVTGSNFTPGASIRLELRSDPVTLATVTADAGGSFSVQVTIPTSFADTGKHLIVAVGGQSENCPADPLTVTIGGLGVEPITPPDGGLSYTGVKVGTFLAIALALIGVGVLLTRSGHRGRSRSSRHSA